MKILVVEDDPDVRDTICDALISIFSDAKITALSDGREFLDLGAQHFRWDLVVVDIMLPQLSGLDISRSLRGTSEAVMVPILAMTGYDTPEMETRALAAGATRYLAKPFALAEFMSVVKEMVG